jgi:hypothetical protein
VRRWIEIENPARQLGQQESVCRVTGSSARASRFVSHLTGEQGAGTGVGEGGFVCWGATPRRALVEQKDEHVLQPSHNQQSIKQYCFYSILFYSILF